RAGRDDDSVEAAEGLGCALGVHAIPEGNALLCASARQVGDVGGERHLARLDLLEERRLAGEAERAARSGLALEDGDGVALRYERGVGEAGRAGADDGDALAARWRSVAELDLSPGGGVDDAAQRGAP